MYTLSGDVPDKAEGVVAAPLPGQLIKLWAG
jgi:hypothetical protein